MQAIFKTFAWAGAIFAGAVVLAIVLQGYHG